MPNAIRRHFLPLVKEPGHETPNRNRRKRSDDGEREEKARQLRAADRGTPGHAKMDDDHKGEAGAGRHPMQGPSHDRQHNHKQDEDSTIAS